MLREYRQALEQEVSTLRRLIYILEQPVIRKLFDSKREVIIALIVSRNVEGLYELIKLEGKTPYEAMTIKQLRAEARLLNIPYYTSYSKADLIRAITDVCRAGRNNRKQSPHNPDLKVRKDT